MESDATCSLSMVDKWIERVAGKRSHIAPDEIPWQAIRTMLTEST